ncbi:MAG: hypothetical protein KDD22_00745 [Bdellovibrionales bacterium]|nr:hypothetical protein [Bdellovibrionales bacterium]
MIDRKWKSVHREINLLSMMLSFTFLIVAWIALGILKYHLYGIAGWGFEWNIKELSIWLQARTFLQLHIQPYALYMFAGILADYFCWPYFLRKENGLKFD